MNPLTQHDGVVVAIPVANIDTDILVPRQYLKRVERSGLADYLFDRWRYLDRGAASDDPYVDCSARVPDPSFALNQPRHEGASFLVAGANFGCGSSREQAVWALAQWGIRVIVAPSFGDIFFNNCLANGVLPVVLDDDTVATLARRAAAPGYRLAVDLSTCRIEDGAFGEAWSFAIDPFRQRCLLDGSDAIALTLRFTTDIAAFERQRERECPWLAKPMSNFEPPKP
jgi:3-isopropylmalate/(R)-2-methylmalate dehydratase small subunit